MDTKLIEEGFDRILRGLGVCYSQRPALIETPARAAKFIAECLSSEGVTNTALVKKYAKSFPVEHNDPISVRGIPVFSFCEHHIALMYDMSVNVAYIPRGKVLGLSKISRLADAAARRLQLQERLTSDIAELIDLAVRPQAVLVRIRGKHSCVTARGIQKDSTTFTESFRGNVSKLTALKELLECEK